MFQHIEIQYVVERVVRECQLGDALISYTIGVDASKRDLFTEVLAAHQQGKSLCERFVERRDLFGDINCCARVRAQYLLEYLHGGPDAVVQSAGTQHALPPVWYLHTIRHHAAVEKIRLKQNMLLAYIAIAVGLERYLP